MNKYAKLPKYMVQSEFELDTLFILQLWTKQAMNYALCSSLETIIAMRELTEQQLNEIVLNLTRKSQWLH